MMYTQVTDEIRKEFWGLIKEASSIVITSHLSPDEDSIAAVLASYFLIKKEFEDKKVRVVYSGEKADRWNRLESYKVIEFVDDLAGQVRETDLLIMLDGGNYDRFSKEGKRLKEFGGKTICIDHHASKPDKFDFSLISTKFSSATEGVYRLMAEGKELEKEVIELLLMGILGDLGGIRYLNLENSEVLEIIKKLVDEGRINIETLMAKYGSYSKKIFEAIGEMTKKTRFIESKGDWPAFQVGMLGRNYCEREGLTDDEVALVAHIYASDYLRSVDGYVWGVAITPRESGSWSLSFRSLPEGVNVRKIAEAFEGGGHDQASAAKIKEEEGVGNEGILAEEILEKLIDWLEKTKKEE